MMVVIDVADLQLAQNHLFMRLEPYLLDGAINYCASYRSMTYPDFHTEMVEYLFDNGMFDPTEFNDRATLELINDLEEHEFNMLVMIAYTIYQRVTEHFKHIWQDSHLKDTVLVGYQGHQNYQRIMVDVELDAPDQLIMNVQNRKALRKQQQHLTYIPKGI